MSISGPVDRLIIAFSTAIHRGVGALTELL